MGNMDISPIQVVFLLIGFGGLSLVLAVVLGLMGGIIWQAIGWRKHQETKRSGRMRQPIEE